MRPDAATARFLEGMRASGAPPLTEQSVDEARAGAKAFHRAVGGSLVDVHRVEDREIATAAGPLRVRVYWPREPSPNERLPIVVYFHGGGFVFCDLDTHEAVARCCCRDGHAIVVNVDY